jgi:16S rRNA (cytidine1402-2'-O)-methyltransferase
VDSDRERTDPRGPSKPAAGLYLAATPIGNLGDVTHRVLDVARAADVIACEDTRVTGRLLRRYGIDTPQVSYYEHNAAKVRPRLLKRLRDGEIVVLMSDAGTPLVSDPGYRLVTEAIEQDTPVHPLPGPSALLAALQVSGLPSDRFLFAGFLPSKSAARRRELTGLRDVPATLIFYESPRRLLGALADMAAVLGDRVAAVARELTKLHEEVRRGPLPDLAADYEQHGPPKGEIVIVVGPPRARETSAADLESLLETSLQSLSVREAVAAVTEATGLPRRRVYERALALSARRASDSDS